MLAFCLWLLVGATAYGPGLVYVPSADAGLYRLANLLRERSSEVSEATADYDIAVANVAQAGLHKNPELGLNLGGIAVPPLTFPGTRLLDQNMNYGAQLSYRIEVDKRHRRIERDRHALQAAKSNVALTLREQALKLAHVLGEIAVNQMRIDAMTELLAEASASFGLGARRSEQGFASGLQTERLHIEVNRLEQQRFSAKGDQMSALAECARLVAMRCQPFATVTDARGFLRAWYSGQLDGTSTANQDVEGRWDIRALDARIASQKDAAGLASAEAWPDPTLMVGFMHDTFVISGNNMNVFNVALSIPLTLFDHGQARAQGARAVAARLREKRERVVLAARERVALLREGLALQRKRQAVIASEMLPRARAVVKDLDKAVAQGALPLSELIIARRALSELLIAEADSERDAFVATVDLLSELGEKQTETK